MSLYTKDFNSKFALYLLMLLLSISLYAGCSAPPQFVLMETPAIYHEAAVDPFAHLDETQHETALSVFYATNRTPQQTETGGLPYGNDKGQRLYLGHSVLRFGDENFSWSDLYLASTSKQRESPIHISLESFEELATLPESFQAKDNKPLSAEQKKFATEINAQLAAAEDKEIMVYVHGTKVDFLNSVAMTAEIDHFTGRDFVGVAFSWPSHQNILYYLFGVDVTRARDSSQALRALLEFLAEHTTAKHINLLSYSAGGRVASKALHELRTSYNSLDQDAVKQKFRLGSVIFAAADVPLRTFQERLPSVSALAQQVVVTVSDHDPALLAAEKYMDGGVRIGEESAMTEELAVVESLGVENLEVIDLSLNHEGRGFDIIGHHYWYRHPWASSDIVLLLRTNLPSHLRGLSSAELEGVFFMSPEYPNEVREATRQELGSRWFGGEKEK